MKSFPATIFLSFGSLAEVVLFCKASNVRVEKLLCATDRDFYPCRWQIGNNYVLLKNFLNLTLLDLFENYVKYIMLVIIAVMHLWLYKWCVTLYRVSTLFNISSSNTLLLPHTKIKTKTFLCWHEQIRPVRTGSGHPFGPATTSGSLDLRGQNWMNWVFVSDWKPRC